MLPSSNTNPQSKEQKDIKSSSSSSKCKLLQMMTPMLLWANVFRSDKTPKDSYQRTVECISSRFSSGIKHFTGGLRERIRKIRDRRRPNESGQKELESDFKSGSIGSRGYEEFQNGNSESLVRIDRGESTCLIGTSSTILNNLN